MRTFETWPAMVTPAVDSPEFWRRAERTAVSSDPDVATAQVVRRMAELATSASSDPLVIGYAQRAVAQFRGGLSWYLAGLDPFTVAPGDGRLDAMIAESVWWFAKHYLRFQHHNEMIWDRLRERDQWQLLISPDVLVRMSPMKGDCAVYSTLIAAMLQALGVRWEFETVAADGSQPGVFSHVFPRAIMPDGSRIPLDASHGEYCGWRVPAHDTFRSQVWDSAGNPVADAAVAQFRGLHAYAVRRRRGLGFNEPGSATATPINYTPGGSSGGGTDWGALFGNMLDRWTTIGSKVLAPEVSYTRGPGGQLQYSAPASSGSVFGSFPTPLLGGDSDSSWIWIGAAGVALLVLGIAFSKGGR